MVASSGSSTEWSFLKLWCRALGPHLSVKECSTETTAFDGFVVQVNAFLGPRRIDSPPNAIVAGLVFLDEALELLSLALRTSSNASSRLTVLELCENEDLMKHLDQHTSEEWKPKFQLAFRGSAYSDCHDALEIVQVFASSRAWTRQRSEGYQVARTLILSRRGVRVAPQTHCLCFSVHLQPPLKDTSNFRTSYLTAPSRTDTINYYDALYGTLKTMASTVRCLGPFLDNLVLDLTNLETPADVIQRLGDVLTLGIPIRRLALKLGYSWDVFDQTKLVSILNAIPSARIDHIVIAATTSDNLEAALDSLPLIENVHHVELVNQVLFGNAASSFWAAFQRVLLSPTKWHPKKLTLRGARFQRNNVEIPTSASSVGLGPDELSVHLAASDLDAFVRILPRFGSDIRALGVHITLEHRTRAISLQCIADACPKLRKLEIHGAEIPDLTVVPVLFEQECAKWTSFVLQGVAIRDTDGLTTLARTLGDPTSKLARNIVQLVYTQPSTLPSSDVDAFYNALESNKRLEHLALGPLTECAKAQLTKFDQESLHDRKYAFLSAVQSPASGQNAFQSALIRIDSWNLARVMDLAGLTRRRRIVVS